MVTEQFDQEQLSKSIDSKRRKSLDAENVPRISLGVKKYDIRKDRDLAPIRKSLEKNGQRQPVSVNIRENGDKILIDGRTRWLASEGVLEFFKCMFYVGLTDFEEDYLNAVINSQQKQLTSDEKREFVKRHKDVMSITALCEALDLTKSQVEDIKISTEVPDNIVELFRNKERGYGRGEIDIQAVSQVAKRVKNEEALKEIGKWQQNTEKTDRNRRKARREIAQTTERWLKNDNITSKYTPTEIVKKAIEKVENDKCSGDTIPKGSEHKVEHFEKIINEKKFTFCTIYMSEGLTRLTKSGDTIDSESKVAVDSPIQEITLIGLELDKLEEVAEYGKSIGKNVIIHCEDVFDYIQDLKPDKRNGIVYVNCGGYEAQRPNLMNLLHRQYPNSVISLVYIDYFYFGKNLTSDQNRKHELATVYGLKYLHSTFADLQMSFKKQLDWTENVEWIKYCELPQSKYLVKIS